jgi:hypothetical protein
MTATPDGDALFRAALARDPNVLVVLPGGDARVLEARPDENRGSWPMLQVDGTAGNQSWSYIKFPEMPASETGARVYLVMHVSGDMSGEFEVWTTDSFWGESTLAWSNRPPAQEMIGRIAVEVGETQVLAIEVTDQTIAGGEFSVVLLGEGGLRVSISSREVTPNGPMLVVVPDDWKIGSGI